MSKDFFKEHNVQYQERDVSTDNNAQQEMIDKSGQLGVPVIDIDGKIVVGFDKDLISEFLSIK